MRNSTRNIVVIGLGYVGLPLVLRAAEKGYSVVGIDIDKRKINLLNKGLSPIANGEFEKKLKKNAPALTFTNHYSGIEEASNIIISVPTPVNEDRTPNLGPLKRACLGISRFLKKGQLVILESTVNPGVSEGMVLPILEDGSNLKGGKDFYLAHCPERINPGNEVKELQHLYKIPRVIGGLEKKGLRTAVAFYRSIINASIKPMGSLQEAESVKMVENIFRDINIALVNELAMSFNKLGIDLVNVINGAATKPFSFMPHYPGVGVGGHCIPVDPYYLIDYAKSNGFEHRFLELGREINSSMPKFTVELLKNALEEANLDIDGAKIAVLGLAYKPGVDDDRESPAHEVIREIKKEGGEPIVFDPYLLDKSDTSSLPEALEESEAVVVTTAHEVFRKLSPRKLIDKGVKVVVDGRNALAKDKFLEAGIIYRGIGR